MDSHQRQRTIIKQWGSTALGKDTYNTPTDNRPHRATFFVLLICKSLIKDIGKAASEKSTQAATADTRQSNNIRQEVETAQTDYH